MLNADRYVFVLWAKNFDEMAATIFVIELRRAGLRVKLVSLTHHPVGGAHGLAFVPDLTLEHALPLAGQSSCVIIPASLQIARQLKTDPRLREFFAQAGLNHSRFVVGPLADGEISELFALSAEAAISYCPQPEQLIRLARELALPLSEIQLAGQ